MHEILQGLLWVVLGSAIGGPTRFLVSGVVSRRVGETFPWGVMVVNISGAATIGFVAAASDARLLPLPDAWQLAVVGFLGSYTTVSSFSLQTLSLVRDGQILRAGSNVFLSIALCLSGAALGYATGAALLGAGAP